MQQIRAAVVAKLTAEEKEALKSVLAQTGAKGGAAATAKPRPLVKQWTVAELVPIVQKGLKKRNFERGRTLFGETKCAACHYYGGEGPAHGPDLTMAGARFNVPDLLESIIEPSKVISDQYAAVVITLKDGRVITGRVINFGFGGVGMSLVTDYLNGGRTDVQTTQIESVEQSKVSMMPPGLIDTLHEDEILDLVAYVLSRNNQNDPMFQSVSASKK
jgi:putative heme-binding domain-containing protein